MTTRQPSLKWFRQRQIFVLSFLLGPPCCSVVSSVRHVAWKRLGVRTLPNVSSPVRSGPHLTHVISWMLLRLYAMRQPCEEVSVCQHDLISFPYNHHNHLYVPIPDRHLIIFMVRSCEPYLAHDIINLSISYTRWTRMTGISTTKIRVYVFYFSSRTQSEKTYWPAPRYSWEKAFRRCILCMEQHTICGYRTAK